MAMRFILSHFSTDKCVIVIQNLLRQLNHNGVCSTA